MILKQAHLYQYAVEPSNYTPVYINMQRGPLKLYQNKLISISMQRNSLITNPVLSHQYTVQPFHNKLIFINDSICSGTFPLITNLFLLLYSDTFPLRTLISTYDGTLT